MTFPHKICLIFLRWTGLCPIEITSSNKIKRSLIWQIWSGFVSTLIIVSNIIRSYMYLKLKNKYFNAEFVLDTISDFEPLYTVVLLANITWTNCYIPKLNQQVSLLNQLLERPMKERLNTQNWDIWFLLRSLLTVQILIIVVVVRYFIILNNLNLIQSMEAVLTLSFSCFIMFHRLKFCFLLNIIKIEFKHINSKLQSYQPRNLKNTIDTFNNLLDNLQLLETIFRPTIRIFLICTLLMLVTGCKGVLELLMSIIYHNALHIDTFIISYWFIQSVPMLIWIIHTGESIQMEVRLKIISIFN